MFQGKCGERERFVYQNENFVGKKAEMDEWSAGLVCMQRANRDLSESWKRKLGLQWRKLQKEERETVKEKQK